MHLKSLIAGAGFAIGAALATSTAIAAPITTGTLGMTFLFQAEAGGAPATLSTATAIDFSPLNGGTGSFLVTQAGGSFASFGIIPFASFGTIQDLVFDAFVGPIVDFFTVGSLNFDLTSLFVQGPRTDNSLTLVGGGIFEAGTADETTASWVFSGQVAGEVLTGEFTWSANASPVPEPVTLTLLGAGLLGLGVARRRMATKA